MIVICTGCQARFRVADDKVGPRGARVRCSRCQTVFVVKREAEPPTPAPKFEIDLTPGTSGPPATRRASAPAGASVVAFPSPAPQRAPAPDPFAAAGLEAFGAPAATDDPFAPGAMGQQLQAEPGGANAAAAGMAPSSEDDPFSMSAPGVEFGAMDGGTTGSQHLPVTDLSQLLGPQPGAAAPPASPHAADPFPDAGFAAELAPPAAPPPSDPFPAPPPEEAADLGAAFPSDLALEDRGTPGVQAPFADPEDVLSTGEASAPAFGGAAPLDASFRGAAFEAGPLDGLDAPGESLSLATEPTPGPEVAEPRPPPPEPAPFVPEVPEAPKAAPPRSARARPVAPPVHPLRSAAVNGLALVVLLAVALAFYVVLRGDASLGPSALRPSTFLRLLRGGGAGVGPVEVAGVRTGVYHQTSGGTLLFVRGEVVSRAAGPVGAVRVEAELVRRGEVLARGEARAGVVPSPEEVNAAVDRAKLEALAAAAVARAPKVVSPGDRLSFFVAFGDAPADVNGVSVRVRALADGAGP